VEHLLHRRRRRSARAWKWGAEHVEKADLEQAAAGSAGRRADHPKAWLWYHKVVGGERCPIVDTWWQTETGCIMITPLPGIVSTKPGSATRPFPGIKADVVDSGTASRSTRARGCSCSSGHGRRCCATLYKEEDRFVETLLLPVRHESTSSATAARKDKDGYVWVIGRIDDVSTSRGTGMSTAEVEFGDRVPWKGRRRRR